MSHLIEKYYRINIDWPNKAGKLSQVLSTQKRLLSKLGNKQSDDVKALMLSMAEGYDVAIDLMKWMEEMLHEVGADSEALREGSIIREQHKHQCEFISELMDARNNRIDKAIQALLERKPV